MKKMALNVDDLSVASFSTVSVDANARGTINGNMSLTGPIVPREPRDPNTPYRISDACLPYTQNPMDTHRTLD